MPPSTPRPATAAAAVSAPACIRRLAPAWALAALAALILAPAAPQAQARPGGNSPATAIDLAPRERVALDSGWRFRQGDPPGLGPSLVYDLRPEVTGTVDGQPADATPLPAAAAAAVQAAAAGRHTVLKPWVLPSANPYIADSARHHRRPPGPAPGQGWPVLQAGYDDSDWQPVRLPHDWAIAGPFLTEGPHGGMGRLRSWGPVWYRRTLDIGPQDRGRRVVLEVEGAMAYATVWLNGELVGGWPYGYTSWQLDLSAHVRPGAPNQLVLRLDNPPDSARWYPGAGLYRRVWLTKTAPVHVAHDSTVVRTPEVSAARAAVTVALEVANTSPQPQRVAVTHELLRLDAQGRPEGAPVARTARQVQAVPAGGRARFEAATQVLQPRLWGPPPRQQPHRYAALSTVRVAGRVVDRQLTRFGIRSLRFDARTGVHVNGQPVRLQGVNLHHDLGALGAAFHERAAERQLQLLQAMGANAIRTAHNPPAPGFLELTDRLGLLVVNEIFDAWERRKTPLDFHLVFPDWHEPDLRALLRRDRNHPSVLMWSVGNEVGEQYTGEAGAAVARRLHAIVREEDPTRPSTTAMNWAKPHMPLPATVDTIGLNYQGEGIRQGPEFEGSDRIRTPPQYQAFHERFPDKLIYGSETASAFSSRGIYLFPVVREHSATTRHGRGGDDRLRQVSAYELHAVDFGSSADKVFTALDRHPFVAGEFVWTGFDYLGEPTPYYGARSAYSGILDLAGLPKDRYFLYQSRWRPELPMAHILPHWSWPERVGQVTPVHVFTSGDEAELFLNGRSLGRRQKGEFEYRLRWDEVVYEPGELRVQAYRQGRPWAQAQVQTAGAPAALALQADRTRLRADGHDLAYVTVRVTDAQGRLAPRATARIRFTVQGPGELLATDNGDATDFEPFPSATRAAFSGQAIAIVRGLRAGGRITVRAEAEGLSPAELVLDSTAP